MAKRQTKIAFLDPSIGEEDLAKAEAGIITGTPLVKSLVSAVKRQDQLKRLAFEEDPSLPHRYGGLFFDKVALIPDRVLKRIAIVDDLVATCVTIRSNQVSPFGHKLADKYSIGFRVEPTEADFKAMSKDEKEDLVERIRKVSDLLLNCGHTDDLKPNELMRLPKFLYMAARSAVVFGRFAVEVIWDLDLRTQKKVFRYFRPVDTGTIYRAVPKADAKQKLREQAMQRLKELKGVDKQKLDPNKFEKDEYTWIQVIEGTPTQAFTSDEMYVHDCYPTTDIELNGYPLTPIDQAIAAITTHINITTTNKLYFAQGRSARGILVIQSDTVDPQALADLKQGFNANINDAGKSGRIPVFKISPEDKISWQSIESARDMEFQMLYDNNCRVVLAAFQMSPDEVPGYSHLSRGTNSQAMSDSSNEYKLEAARDVGIRPLLSNFQEFLNQRILPLLDEKVAKHCTIKLYGLDAVTVEQENDQIEKESQLSQTYDDIMRIKEKDPVGKRWGGEYPLNPNLQLIHDKLFTVGEIREHFLGVEGASKDPQWAYVRDAFYFQHQQVIQAEQQIQEQKKMAEQQQAQGGQPPQQPGADSQQQSQPPQQPEGGDELVSGIDQLISSFSKSEADFKAKKKKWLAHHEFLVSETIKELEKESEKAIAESAQLASKNRRE